MCLYSPYNRRRIGFFRRPISLISASSWAYIGDRRQRFQDCSCTSLRRSCPRSCRVYVRTVACVCARVRVRVDDKKIRRDACRRNDRPPEPEAADRPAVGAAAREGADDRMIRRAYSKRGSPMMLGGGGVGGEYKSVFNIERPFRFG